MVRPRGRGRGDPVGQDRRLPRGLPLLLAVVAVRHRGAGHPLPRHRGGARGGPRDQGQIGASEFCIVLAVRGPDEKTMQRLEELVPLVQDGDRPERRGVAPASSPTSRPPASPRSAPTATTTTSRRRSPSSRASSPPTPGRSAPRPASCVREHGMELCCGVLLGMGESLEQRLELLEQLRDVEPAEVPLNFLNPRPGTPLQIRKPVQAARGHPLDRPVPPGPALGHPPLRRRPGDHPRATSRRWA